MTKMTKLVSILFAVVLGASLACVPIMSFADEATDSKGIADQFSNFGTEGDNNTEVTVEEETVEYADGDEDAEEAETTESYQPTTQSDGYSAGQNATGDWMNEAAPSTYVFDEYGLFSSSEYSQLESTAESLAKQYGMGVYFLTTGTMNGNYNPSSDERTRYATGYYVDHSLGLGPGKDGIMFVVAADSRDYVTIAYGQGSYSFSDSGISSMEDDVTSYLGDNDWFGAAEAYYNDIGDQLEYYAQKGTPGKPLDAMDYALRIGIILVIPLIIAIIVVSSMKSKMKTAREKTEARDYLDQSSLVLTISEDTFINSSVIATPRNEDKGGGGGGGWGGGGGGGFSSSGGGKF